MRLIASILLALFSSFFFNQMNAAASGAGSQFLCERYIEFLAGDDPRCKMFSIDSFRFANFSEGQKSALNQAFITLNQKCPQLIKAAQRGGRIPVAYCVQGLPHNKDVNTFPLIVCVAPELWNSMAMDPQHRRGNLPRLLSHELTHIIDFRGNIACNPEWAALFYRPFSALQVDVRSLKSRQLDPTLVKNLASKHGFPTRYALENPREALAESTAALIFDQHPRLPGADAFVQQQILNQSAQQKKMQTTMRAGYLASYSQRYGDALACFRQAVKLSSNAGDAHAEIGRCLGCLNRRKEALVAFEQAIQIFRHACFLDDDSNVDWMLETTAELRKELKAGAN